MASKSDSHSDSSLKSPCETIVPSLREALSLRTSVGLPNLNARERGSWYSCVCENAAKYINPLSRGFKCSVCLESNKENVFVSSTCGHLLCGDCYGNCMEYKPDECPQCRQEQVWWQVHCSVKDVNLTRLLLCSFPCQRMFIESAYEIAEFTEKTELSDWTLLSCPKGTYTFLDKIPCETEGHLRHKWVEALSYVMLLCDDLEEKEKLHNICSVFSEWSHVIRQSAFLANQRWHMMSAESEENYEKIQLRMLKNAIMSLRETPEKGRREICAYLHSLKLRTTSFQRYGGRCCFKNCNSFPNFKAIWYDFQDENTEDMAHWRARETDLNKRMDVLLRQSNSISEREAIIKWHGEMLSKIYVNYRLIQER